MPRKDPHKPYKCLICRAEVPGWFSTAKRADHSEALYCRCAANPWVISRELASAALVLKRSHNRPRPRPDDSICYEIGLLLELFHSLLGLGAEVSVDAVGVETDSAHPAL